MRLFHKLLNNLFGFNLLSLGILNVGNIDPIKFKKNCIKMFTKMFSHKKCKPFKMY